METPAQQSVGGYMLILGLLNVVGCIEGNTDTEMQQTT